jgi:geranylgeranyl diphosphate synthase type II
VEFTEFTTKYYPVLEQFLQDELENVSTEKQLQEAMQYSVMAGGKRLRPLLTLVVAQTFGVDPQTVFKTASAIELIHTYSLIHDDLPAMDDDEMRRGKPTTHKVFGEDLAILAGDALQPLAFEWVVADDIQPTQKVALVQALAKAAGANGMVAGQVADMHATAGETLTVAELKNVHLRKTGALLAYAMVAGGILAGVSSQAQTILHEFGVTFGLAFQIKDDLVDLAQDDGEDKQSYPYLLGVNGARAELKEQVELARHLLADFANETQTDMTLLASSLNYFDDMVD